MTLTPRQTQVIRLIARGLIDKEIADSLGVTTHCVHFHVRGIMVRLNAKTKANAVYKFYRYP